MPDRQQYRIGVVGCGRKGTSQARAFMEHPRSEVVAAADLDKENLDLFTERFGVPGYSTYQAMLSEEKVDIVLCILPVGVNPDVVVGVAEYGPRLIFSEKPISTSLEEADRMVEACRSRGVKLAGADMNRNLEQVLQVRRTIQSGEIGNLQNITMFGATTTGGCQPANLMRALALDADAEWVVGWVDRTAVDKTVGEIDEFSDHDQGAAGVVQFASGVKAVMHLEPSPIKGFRVNCTRGYIEGNFHDFQLFRLNDGIEPGKGAPGLFEEVAGAFKRPEVYGQDREYTEDGWRQTGDRTMDTTQSMIDALDRDIEPRTSGDDLRKAIEITIAFRESHRRGHVPVHLPLEDRSLKITPVRSRMYNKKEVFGAERYADEIARAKPA